MNKIRKSSVLKIILDALEELEMYRETLYSDTDGNKIQSSISKISLLNSLYKKIEEL